MPDRPDPVDGPPAPPPVTSEQLTELLGAQHTELERLLTKVSELHGAAREDVFLQARRLLAVHETLERLLATTGGDPAGARTLREEVESAEQVDPGSPEFEGAFARVVQAYQEHSRRQEHDLARRLGALQETDRTRVATAVRLWQGEGDAYLGNSYAEMLGVAEEQLDSPSPETVRNND